MIRVHAFVEGQTEETFVRELLYGYFQEKNIFLNPIIYFRHRRSYAKNLSFNKGRRGRQEKSALTLTLILSNDLS